MSDKKWLKEKTVIVLSREEMFELANCIHDASLSDVDFTKIRDRRIKKTFREAIQKRHNLWKKILRVAERAP